MAEEKKEETVAELGQAHWRALWHPLRVGILGLLQNGERTNEELARELGVPSGKLYHHTKLLLNAGLIELAGTRQNKAITEKVYRATSRQLVVKKGFHLADAIAAGLTLYRNTIKEGEVPFQFGAHVVTRVPRSKLPELQEKLQALVESVHNEPADPDSVAIALTVLAHSLSPVQGREAEKESQ